MTPTEQAQARVFELIAAYGSEPGAWPEDERSDALACIASGSEQFAAALAAARAIDLELAAIAEADPSPDLFARIMADAPQAPTARPRAFGWLRFTSAMRWPASAALASLAMGIGGGYAAVATGLQADRDDADAAFYAAFGYEVTDAWLGAETEG